MSPREDVVYRCRGIYASRDWSVHSPRSVLPNANPKTSAPRQSQTPTTSHNGRTTETSATAVGGHNGRQQGGWREQDQLV